MTSSPSSRIYTCEFYNYDYKVKHLYEIAFEILPREQGRSNALLKPDECPIRVHTINGAPIANGHAVAIKIKYEYMGTVLFSILLNRVSYVSTVQYWFPLCERPAELVDGSIRVHTTDTKDMEIVFLTPLDTLPFMDATGTFAYQYKMVSKMNMLTPKGHVFPKLNTPMTLYQSGDKFQMMQDNKTMAKYKIEGVTTFREMPFYDLQ